jgi:hypothetical protein
MRTLLFSLLLISVPSLAGTGNTQLLNEKFTIDFSKSENLFDKKNSVLLEKVKKIARTFAKEGSVYEKPVEYESLNFVLNPVLDSQKYKYHFRFNLKATDGRVFNCVSVADQTLESYLAGCYAAIP